MEDLLALAELHALLEYLPGDLKLHIGDLLIVDGDTAACHVLPGIAVGGSQLAGYHQAQQADFALRQLVLGDLGGGDVGIVSAADEQGLSRLLGLLGLLLAMYCFLLFYAAITK